MIYIRSLIFKIYFPLWTALVCTLLYPTLFMGYKAASLTGRIWAFGVVWGCRIISGVSFEVKGEINLPKEGPFILACKHQSSWDTAIFLMLFNNNPVYILKKELLKIPLFGSYLKAIDMVPVDRSGGSSALKSMTKMIKERTDKGRSVVIFPEGTRTLPGEKVKYQPGIAFIYLDESIKAPVIPTVLNSGKFWSNKKFLTYPGTINIEYFPEIKPGLNRKKFMEKLETTMEEASDRLINT